MSDSNQNPTVKTASSPKNHASDDGNDTADPDNPGPSPTKPSPEQPQPTDFKDRHDEISRNIRAVGLALITYALFCFLTLGQSDAIIFKRGGEIKIPFADVKLDFFSFMLAGPVILMIITSYLHIFIHEWRECHKKLKKKDETLPFLFNLERPWAKGLTQFIFYFLPPLVMMVFVLKARAFHWGWFWSLAGGVFTFYLIISYYKNHQEHTLDKGHVTQFLKKAWLLFLVFFCFVFGSWPKSILYLHPIQLSKKSLENQDFSKYILFRVQAPLANLKNSNFSGNQHIQKSNFSNANLSGSRFYGTNLEDAIFVKTTLMEADFSSSESASKNMGQKKYPMELIFERHQELDNLPERTPLENTADPGNGPERTPDGDIDTKKQPKEEKNASKKKPQSTESTKKASTINPATTIKGNQNKEENSENPKGVTNLKSADMSQAILSKAKLIFTDCTETDFRDAQLDKANFYGAILHKAIFFEANLSGARFFKANLKEADFSGSDVRFADFRGSQNLEEEQIKKAVNWQRALYDPAFAQKLGLTPYQLKSTLQKFIQFLHPAEMTAQDRKQIIQILEREELGTLYGIPDL